MESDKFLIFDNYPFKLAVIQKLMYDFELLGEKYRGGDQYFEAYDDVEEVSEEESIERLKSYIERANQFFQALRIPCSLADQIKDLYVGAELDVYYQINPQWADFDEYFEDGRDFDIVEISERELRQFPDLESITFNMYHEPPEELVKKLTRLGIQVNQQD